jgi:hypothetical protein
LRKDCGGRNTLQKIRGEIAKNCAANFQGNDSSLR